MAKDEDVSQLTDEELAEAVNPTPEKTPKQETQEKAQGALEEVKKESEPEASEEVEPSEEEPKEELEEKPPSRREQLRVQQLLKKYGPPPQPKTEDGLDYREALDADPEVIERLEADRKSVTQSSYNAGLEQAKSIQFHTRLEIDAPRVESKYKFLDPTDKDNFDPQRADAMNALYLFASGYEPGDPDKGIPETIANPNIRYRDFVEAQMEFAEALMADRQAASSKNIARQTAQTGLRPDGSSAKRLNLNRPPHEMTMEELYASIGQTPPKQ